MREFAREIEERKAAGLYRTRRVVSGPQQPRMTADGEPVLAFCSNDYLGLANHPALVEAAKSGLETNGLGGAASHLICGHHQAHHRLEERLAAFTGRTGALFFSTGYMANMGVISAMAGRGDTIFSDSLNHASIIDGCKLSRATIRTYPHGDTDTLAQQLAETGGHKLVVTDGVFSMDGDIAPLRELAGLCRIHNALLVVDDAHGFGCVGPQGRGSVFAAGLTEEEAPLVIGTFGKAFGSSGAFVVGPELLMDYLVQKARTYIYTTAMPPALAIANQASIDLVERDDERRYHLQRLIKRFRSAMTVLGYSLLPSITAIQPVMVGDAKAALRLSAELEKCGLLVTAIRPPTVPQGASRLRVTLSASHTDADLDRLIEGFSACAAMMLPNVQAPIVEAAAPH
ncbi:MAG: 8-amino-7-oxononanoate synthase [Marinobacter sp.]|uniref:8-amino-7-oxononanoate synthase n=1 Tax=Marinobacter sp. TaxID=50741 RepID=UPI0034A054EF